MKMMMIPVLLPCILLYLREIHRKIHIIHGRKSTAILFMITKIWEWRDIRWQDFCRWEMRMDRHKGKSDMEKACLMQLFRSEARHPARMHKKIIKLS